MSVRPVAVYTRRYDVDYGRGHDFSARKFALAAEFLRERLNLVEPEEPPREDLLLAHDETWTDKVLSGRLSHAEVDRLELPFSPAIALAHRLAAGGTLLAARRALESGVGLHCGGGAHHAFRDHGEGYCAVNDLAIAALKLRAEGRVRRVGILDLDAHQGNGTASILAREKDVFTVSLHNGAIYPEKKERSWLDVSLEPGTGDAVFLAKTREALEKLLAQKPELVLYQAGVDPWEKDLKGGLAVSEQGLLERDLLVRDACAAARTPVAVTLGGGYGPSPEDTARLHARTLQLFAGLVPM